MKQIIYKVNSDNIHGEFMTNEAYDALVLSMSSGDYGSHTKQRVKSVPKGSKILSLFDIDPSSAIAKILDSYPKHLKDFAHQKSFRSKNTAGGLDSYDNYLGEDYDFMVCSLGRSRDSDNLAESNFETALEMFGGESETVVVNRLSHWLCGWIEGIMIDPRDRKALQTAYEIHKAIENYCVLDDSDYSQRQHDDCMETLQDNSGEFERTIRDVLGLTDVELSKPEQSDLDRLVGIIFDESRSYQGDDEAWVCADRVIEAIISESYEVEQLESMIGEYALACAGLKSNSDYQDTYNKEGERIWIRGNSEVIEIDSDDLGKWEFPSEEVAS